MKILHLLAEYSLYYTFLSMFIAVLPLLIKLRYRNLTYNDTITRIIFFFKGVLFIAIFSTLLFVGTTQYFRVNIKQDYTKAELRKIVIKAAQKHKIPITIAQNLVYKESAWDYMAVSSARAIGLTQVLPETFVKWGSGNPFNPKDNCEAGFKYLSHLHKKYGGSWEKSLAHYNGGGKAVIQNWKQCQAYAQYILSKSEYK